MLPKPNTKTFEIMKKIVICSFLLLALLVSSCKTQPIVVEKTIETTHTIVERDTVFTIEPDTVTFQALLECRKGKVVVTSSKNIATGKKLKQNVSIKDNVLTIDCIKEVQELKAQLREKNTQKTIKEPVVVEVPAKISSWQWFQIWCGRILLLGLLIVLIGYLFKTFKP